LLKDDDYLVIIRDGNLYTIQNSNAKLLAMSKEKIEEAVRRGDVKREEIEEVERRSKELGLDKLVLKTIKVLRYEPRKI
jgi:hypothetical protein